MARNKTIDRNPRLIAISLDAQLLPGTFEHALDYLNDHEMDLSAAGTKSNRTQMQAVHVMEEG